MGTAASRKGGAVEGKEPLPVAAVVVAAAAAVASPPREELLGKENERKTFHISLIL